MARPDSHRRGRGGSTRADSAAINLADRDEGLTLSREVTSRIDRDQIQRLDTAADRASNEDRRSTTHPMELVFLATKLNDYTDQHGIVPLAGQTSNFTLPPSFGATTLFITNAYCRTDEGSTCDFG